MTYDDADQLTQGPAGTYTYNPLGERTQLDGSGGTTNYSWDQAGDFTGARTSDGTVNLGYGYDGNGLLQTSDNGTSTTQFTWDPNNDVPLLIVEGGTDFIYGPGDLPIEQIGTDGTPLYYHHDQLGSTVLLTNQAGSTIETVKYSAYGAPTITSGTAATPLLYGGAYTDPTTGLQYLQARWYDPGTGDFVSRDPLASLTQQSYAYGGDDPTIFGDPTGMHSFWHYLADPFVAAASAVVDHPGYVAAGLGIVSLATGLGEAYLAIDLTEDGSTDAGIDAAATGRRNRCRCDCREHGDGSARVGRRVVRHRTDSRW